MFGSGIELISKDKGLLAVLESWDMGRAVELHIVSAGELLIVDSCPSTGNGDDLFIESKS